MTLSQIVAGGYQLSYAFMDGTAVRNSDHSGTDSTLWFSVDSATQYIPFQILDDAWHAPEQFYIKVTDQQTGMTRTAVVDVDDHDTSTPPERKPKFDLDIDSDNNNGSNYPKNTEWEEFLEDSPYALGKLVMQNFNAGADNASHFTPMRLRFEKGLAANDPNTRVRLDFAENSTAGTIALWNRPKSEERNGDDAADGGNRILSGVEYSLAQLGYDAATGGATVYIAGNFENTDVKQMKGAETFGNPGKDITATLVSISGGVHEDVNTDKVKYLVTQRDSFYYQLQFNPDLRLALASRGVYGEANIPSDMPTFAMD